MSTSSNFSASWSAIKALFEQALDLPAGERATFVAGIVLEDEGMRAELRSLLAHHEASGNTGGFLGQAAAPALRGAPGDGAARAGQRLGAWEIVQPLGAGGMGEVFEARRADGQYQGRAAIKLLKRGMDSAAVLARFAQERQALARLQHPNIASLLDAGLSSDGLPFFVMAFVDGRTLDVAARELPLEQRLALFLQLCDAVAYAHRQLLVHRDLKPGNVLVTPEGQVMLLDFGIAKALDPTGGDGNATTGLTMDSVRPFTPNYASPEQVRGEPVGTATDIYSLGVLLYQLLTGVRPTGRRATSPAEAARSVLEEVPTRPSALPPEAVPDPTWLQQRKRLQGDLDNILLKTLDKNSEQRYASVDALAADIRAHLGGYPVSARPQRWHYLFRRFLARHKLAVGFSAAGLLALIATASIATWQAHEAETQRQLAERRFNEVRQFARTMLFEVDTALRDGPTAGREKLVSTAQYYLDRLSTERLSDVALLRDVAEGYERIGDVLGNTMQSNLGRPDDARLSYAKALKMREALATLAPQDLQNIAGLKNIHARFGDNARGQGDLIKARQHYEQAARHAGSLARAQPDDLKTQLARIEADRYLASVFYWPFNASLRDYAQARPRIEALDREMDQLQQRYPERSEVLEAYGGLLNQLSDFQRVAGEFPASLQTQRKSHRLALALLAQAPNNPRWQRWLYLAQGRLADALIETGDFEAGIAMWGESIAGRERVAREDAENERAQRNLANGFGPLAEQLDGLDRHAEALQWYQRERALLSRLRAKHPQVLALKARLDESERDTALQLSLTGQAGEGVQLMRALIQRRGPSAVDNEEAAKYALVQARVLLGRQAPAVPDAERAALLQSVEKGLQVLRKAAALESFNVLLAREAALAAYWLGELISRTDPARACGLRRQAQHELEALGKQGRLPQGLARWLAGLPRSAC